MSKSDKKNKPKLTPRQNRFIKELAKGKAQGDAAIAAGYTDKHSNQAGYQAMEQIRMKMPQILEQHGLTDAALIDNYLLPLMNARETKFFHKDGKIKQRVQVVAWGPRREGLDMAFRLKGSYATPAEGIGGSGGPTVIVLDIPRPIRPALMEGK